MELTSNEIVKNLILVGYKISEIAKFTGINRVTLSSILKNSSKKVSLIIREKLINFFNKNIEEVEIGNFKNQDYMFSTLIYTPDGWQEPCGYVEKGKLPCYKIKTVTHETIAAAKHIFQKADNSWVYTDELKVGDELLCINGIEKVEEITFLDEIECVDITIRHPEHRYYLNGISSHNTGKSLLAARLIAAAQRDGAQHVFYFDAEGGGSKSFFKNAGCDPNKIEEILVKTIEDAELKILDTFNFITDYRAKEPEAKFFCVLDSLGALVPEKVARDAEKNKVASEMGGRSKLCNTMMKAITVPCLESGTPMIVINHVYDNPGAMFTSKIMNQGGGKGLQYMGTINIQCTKKLEKEEESGSEQYFEGTHLQFFTVKNRMCRPGLSTEIFLDFKEGFNRQFEPLFSEAVRGGFIVETSRPGYYTIPSWTEPDKAFSEKVIVKHPEFWKTFIRAFDEWSQKDLAYSSLGDVDDFDINDEFEKISTNDDNATTDVDTTKNESLEEDEK